VEAGEGRRRLRDGRRGCQRPDRRANDDRTWARRKGDGREGEKGMAGGEEGLCEDKTRDEVR